MYFKKFISFIFFSFIEIDLLFFLIFVVNYLSLLLNFSVVDILEFGIFVNIYKKLSLF